MDNYQATSTVFFYIVKQLREKLLDGYLNNVQTIDKNVWKLKIHKKKTKELIVTPEICFISEKLFPVTDILGFEKYLKKKMYNQKIKDIYQDKNNKVICFVFDKYNLIFEFFSNSNIILTDLDFIIITSKQKEAWKDRSIKKGEKYLFPGGEDIKLKTEKEINEELKDLDQKEIIKVLSKKYNVAPIEVNEIIDNKKNIIKEIFKKYTLEKPKLKIIEKDKKKIGIVSKNGEDIFSFFENYFSEKYENKEVVIEKKKKDKNREILEIQENKKIEILEKIKSLEQEGEFIYNYFTIIENINKQIKIAIDKKINEKEIIEKINQIIKKDNLKINSINQKNKAYEIEKIEKK